MTLRDFVMYCPRSWLCLDQAAVDAHVAAFEADLAAAASARDAQAVRDRYLGRKNSVVASWMQTIAGAPPDQKKRDRPASRTS